MVPHVDGYPAALIHLRVVSKRALREAIEDGWLVCAPRRLADDYMARKRFHFRDLSAAPATNVAVVTDPRCLLAAVGWAMDPSGR
jgi:hypothetical protein